MVCDKSWPDVAAGVGIIALRGFFFLSSRSDPAFMEAAYHRFIPSYRRRRGIMINKVIPARLVRITIPKNDQIREVGQTPASDEARKCQEETEETHHDDDGRNDVEQVLAPGTRHSNKYQITANPTHGLSAETQQRIMVHILHWLLASGVATAIVRSFFFLYYYDAAHSPDQAGTA